MSKLVHQGLEFYWCLDIVLSVYHDIKGRLLIPIFWLLHFRKSNNIQYKSQTKESRPKFFKI